MLPDMVLLSYIHTCATPVADSTMFAIVKTESLANPLAIGINKGYHLRFQPQTFKQASIWADYLEQHQYNFDIGLAQVNVNNIHRYGYKARDMLNPCNNLFVASRILQKNYFMALRTTGNTQNALRKAISAYNSGNFHAGFTNGYVARVIHNAH